jgi:regulator of protease activity HflC (stomatin/prohibitin superfamily)
MRIDSSGNVLVGTTGISTGTFKGFQNAAGGADANYLSRNSSGTANRQWSFGMNSQDQYVVYGYNTTSFNTGAYIAWGGTSWTASSDERLKDIIEPITDAVNKVSTLRTVIGKYKTDEEGTRRPFLIAQDVQKVLPEAVDATNPEKLGVSYTDVIPLLVASIKEQQQIITDLKATVDAQVATINDLKARVETLEAK